MTAAVSLPMYDLPALRPANQALWSALAAALRADGYRDLPAQLGSDDGPAPDRDFRDLLFTQTCGYPLQTILRGQLRVLATPGYHLPGCTALTHRALIVVREADPARTLADLRGRRFARNAAHSNSGMNLPRRLFAPLARDGRFFDAVVDSGSHARSLALVQHGAADVASIDCVTWGLIARHAPAQLHGLRIIAQTAPSPSLPFVTGANTPDALADALQRALLAIGSDPDHAPLRAALDLATIGVLPRDAYDIVLRYEQEAVDAGYPVIA